MNAPNLTNPTVRPVLKRILRCIGLLRGQVFRDLGVLYRREFHSDRFAPQDWYHPLRATTLALLRGCGADLRTALCRMERRFDVLPENFSFPVGSCLSVSASGNLRPNTDSLARMTDIENFQKEHPKATLFDEEFFCLGWEAGAKYGSGRTYSGDAGQNPCNSPDRNRIADSSSFGGAA